MKKLNIKNDIIRLPIGKILITREKVKKHFKKVNEDNTISDLTHEEQEYINNIFYLPQSTIIYSEKVSDIIMENEELKQSYEFWAPIVEGIDEWIPDNAKANFHRNIKSLKTGFFTEEEKSTSVAYYDIETNEIKMSQKFFNKLINCHQDGTIDNIALECSHIIIHEMLHMASSKYNKETGEVKTGFHKFTKGEERNVSNMGMTEGYSEDLADRIVKRLFGKSAKYNQITKYKPEQLITKQLQFFCNKEMRDGYFDTGGIEPVKQKMEEYFSGGRETVDLLFETIEYNFLLRKEEEKEEFQSSLPETIQSALLIGLENKVTQDIENGKFKNVEELEEYLDGYQKFLITPENLRLSEKDIQKFPGLENIQRLYQDVKKYSHTRLSVKLDSERNNRSFKEEIKNSIAEAKTSDYKAIADEINSLARSEQELQTGIDDVTIEK